MARMFLVPHGPAGVLARAAAREIRQGYLAIDGSVEVRVRDDGRQCTLTVKGGHGRTRAETELVLKPGELAALWPLTAGRRVDKRRHVIDLPGGLVLELDVYSGPLQGLMTAEVEFPSEAAGDAFAPPDWLGEELTGDRRYANQALAVHGRP
jgi:CYTH domain-containing protein